MTAEPTANSFRAAVLAGNGARTEPLIVREKRARVDRSIHGLHSVSVPRDEPRRRNQRGGDRHRLSDSQALLRHRRRKHTVELINLSGGGAMIRADVELRLWDRVELILGEGGELECAVRWVKGDRVGLEFAHETHIDCDRETRDALLRDVIRQSFPDVAQPQLQDPVRDAGADAGTTPVKVGQQRADRHPLVWNGVVYHEGGTEPVRLRNISTTGALVQCGEPLAEGATVWLEMAAAGRHAATVRWTRGDQSGLEFEEPFDIQCLSKSRPEVAPQSDADDGENPQAWAPAWKRSTLDELARNLGG